MTPIEHIQEQKIIKQIVSAIRKKPVEVIINEPELCGLVISAIYRKIEGRMGVVVPDDKYLNSCQANIQKIDDTLINQFYKEIRNETAIDGFVSELEERFEIGQRALENKKRGLYIASKGGLKNKIKKIKKGNDEILIKTNEKIDLKNTLHKLDSWGYTQSDWCASKKMYAVRGGIVDIFPTLHKLPIRLELEGNTVVSMRKFNIATQESVKKIDSIDLYRPIVVKSSSYDGTLNNIYSVNLDFLLYIIPFNGTNIAKKSSHFDLYCEKIPTISPSLGLIDKKIENLTKNVKRVYVFKGLSDKITKNKKIVVCKSTFNANLKSKQLNAVFLGYTDKTNKPKQINIDGVKQKKVFKLDDIKWGDILVHRDYGLGVYRGLGFVGPKQKSEENIKIEYVGGTNVFVPINKFDRIHKYIGPGGATPKLTRLGSGVWEKQKLTTKKSVKKVVGHLIESYKQKQKPRGYSYSGDEQIIQRVVDDFPYTETPDQSTAIDDVYRDMSGSKPMDRLVYGDVGFGKTEVAIRAAILAITSGRSVFFLAPTTVLSDQHYINCVNRLGGVGVNVELLSRFKTKKEQQEIIKKFDLGLVDLLVGTHRLLSGDIDINRLGLLIVDEEHRFGVKHKEEIRRLKNKVDVLTLTATPIPRTLQQSLVGIRDTSKIETPPQDRLPIKTFINQFNWVDIKNKIDLELKRGGQVYFVHNEIENMPFIVDKISGLFPNSVIRGAHGQMPSGPLEKTVLGFFNKKVDVLVCTTIIESGLDVKNANTIIVNNAQNFGLSQLYQIRGRVGRGNRQAYCFLCVPQKTRLLPDAYQRLKSMEYYTSLGSGYDVAIKDLEIRGAGNMFGYEQSGQMLQVGLELYNKILEETIDEGRGSKKIEKNSWPVVNIDQPALIGLDYMPSAQDRLYYYQQIASAKTTQEVDEIKGRLIDQFGRTSGSIDNLFIVAKLRCLLFFTPIEKCTINKKELGLFFKTVGKGDVGGLLKTISSLSKKKGKSYKFKEGRTSRGVVFSGVGKGELVDFVHDFGLLFSG